MKAIEVAKQMIDNKKTKRGCGYALHLKFTYRSS
jgi:hypothetical protein